MLVAASGALSGIFVVIANAWMNAPTGFTLVDGRRGRHRSVAAMLNPAAFSQTLHMTLAAYAATGLAVAGIHACAAPAAAAEPLPPARRSPSRSLVGAPAAILQPISGDLSAKYVARHQPAKLAAMEGHFETARGAPLVIGGWPDVEARETRFGDRDSRTRSRFLAFDDPDAEVMGLDALPREDWPTCRSSTSPSR